MPIKYVDGKKVHLPYPKKRNRSIEKNPNKEKRNENSFSPKWMGVLRKMIGWKWEGGNGNEKPWKQKGGKWVRKKKTAKRTLNKFLDEVQEKRLKKFNKRKRK